MQRAAARRTNEVRSATTSAAIVAAARRLFVRKGYAATGTPEIVAAAKMTRGALYHHFKDKEDLFLAVARQAAREVAEEIARRSAGRGTPRDALLAGAEAYFAAMAEHGRARLLLLDAPSILKPAQLLELSELAGSRELREGLVAVLPRLSRDSQPIDELTKLLSAAFDRAALAIASGQPAGRYKAALGTMLRGIARAQ